MDEEILIILALFLIFGVPVITFIGLIVAQVKLSSRLKKVEAEIAAFKQSGGFIGAAPAAGAAVNPSKAEAVRQTAGAGVPAPGGVPAAPAAAAPAQAALSAAAPAASVSPAAAPAGTAPELQGSLRSELPGAGPAADFRAGGPLASAVSSAAPPVMPKAEKKPQKKGGSDLESFFLDNIFSKLGALAIIVFIILFIKWASSFALVTPAMKVASVYLLSLAFAGAGLFMLKKPNMRGFSELLIGLGVAGSIIITYAGSFFYNIWDPWISVALASLILLAVYAAAGLMQRISVLCMGIVGGYANLIFIYSAINNDVTFCIYLAFLTALCVFGALRCRAWKALVSINLAISAIALVLSSSDFKISVTGTVIWGCIWLLHILYDFFRTDEGEASSFNQHFSVYFNQFVLLAVGNFCCLIHCYEGNAVMAAAVSALGFAAYLRRFSAPRLSAALIYMAVFSAAGAIISWDSMLLRLLALGAGALAVMYGALSLASDKAQRKGLLVWGHIYLLLMIPVITTGDVYFLSSEEFSFKSLAIVLFGIMVAFWLAAHVLLRLKNSDDPKFNATSLWAAVTLAHFYVGLELYNFFCNALPGADADLIEDFQYFSIVILLTVYAVLTLWQYSRSGNRFFVISGALAAFYGSLMLFAYMLSADHTMLPIANIGFVSFGLAIILACSCAYVYKSRFHFVWTALLCWALVHTEGRNFVDLLHMEAITTVFWSMCAAAILFVGIRFKERSLTFTGIFIVACTLVRVVFYDIADLSTGYKLVSFLVLGVMLLAVSFFYSKRRHIDSALDNTVAVRPPSASLNTQPLPDVGAAAPNAASAQSAPAPVPPVSAAIPPAPAAIPSVNAPLQASPAAPVSAPAAAPMQTPAAGVSAAAAAGQAPPSAPPQVGSWHNG